MAVVRSIQKAIPGLAKFLGATSQGVLKMDSDNLVRPVLEMDDYLGPNGWSLVTSVKTVVGQDVQITTPDKKFRRAKWASISVDDTLTGGWTQVGLYIYKQNGGVIFPMCLKQEPLLTIGGVPLVNRKHGFGLNLSGLNIEPGDSIAARVDALTGAGNRGVDLFVQYQELDL